LAQATHLLISSPIAHDAHRPHRQQNSERLRQPIINARAPDLAQKDVVRLPVDRQLLLGDLAQHPDRHARPRERMPPNQLPVDVEQLAQGTNLVLEQLSERLDELEPHVFEQATNIVVGLDGS